MQFVLMTTAHAVSLRNGTAPGSGSGSPTVAQLLADVQAAVADDPALAHMFDIENASELSDAELTSLLRDLLNTSVLGSASTSASGSGSGSEGSDGSMERREDASAATDPTTPSGALKSCSLSGTIAVVATGVALGVALVW